MFFVTISGNFEHFQYFNFERDFSKMKIFFQKLEYRVLDESTKIENASCPYKTSISEASVKTNRMMGTEWSYNKERNFASNYFIFF